MKLSLLGASLSLPLAGAALLALSVPANAFTFAAGSEVQLDVNLILDGSGNVLFSPSTPLTSPPTPAPVGTYALFDVGTGTNTGDFAVLNSPNAPNPPGSFPVQGEILSFQVNPVTLDVVTPLPINDFLIIPPTTPEAGEAASAIPETVFTVTDLDISGINQIGVLPDNVTPVFSSFDITGTGFFTADGMQSDAILEFTTQGFFSEDLNGNGVIGDIDGELDTEGSLSGTIIVVEDVEPVPEPTSILGLLFVGSAFGAGVYKNKSKKFH